MPARSLALVLVMLATAIGVAARGDPPAQAVVGPAAFFPPDTAPVEDPFPLRRLRATEAQVPDLAKQLDAGLLVSLPRGEFEARVRTAGRAAADARTLPRLGDARFKAALVEGELVGSAELELVNPAATPRFVPLDPLRLALGRATWGDGRAAVVGSPGGAIATGAWVDRPGRQTLKFDWSLAGITEPGERQFELRVPLAPTASLELELPTGQVPTVSATEVMLTGPFPVTDNPQRAAWRFRFGGRSRLDFAVRPAGNPGLAAAAALKANYDITPGQLSCTFEYDLRPAKGTVGEWEFAIDPGLRVTDVVVNNRASWSVDPPPSAGAPRRLRVTLRQPGAGGKVLVAAVAPFPDPTRPADAPLPIVRPVHGNLDDETIDVRLANGMRFDRWNPGDYRLTEARVLADQTRAWTLTGTLLPPGQERQFRRAPSIQTAPADAEFTTSEQVAWRCEADRLTATVNVTVQVRRGALFQLALRPAAKYALTRATSPSDELVSHAGTTGGSAVVEFTRPLLAGQTAELTFEFRGPPLVPDSARVPFPAFTPVGATERVGLLAIVPGSAWEVESHPGVGTVTAGWLGWEPPAVPAGASAAFRYRGSDPDGSAVFRPLSPAFTVDVLPRPTPGGAAFTLRVERGTLGSVVAMEPTDRFANRTWRVTGGENAVAAAVPLPRWSAWPLRNFAGDRANLWLIRFARPVAGEVTLETAAFPSGGGPPGNDADAEWSVAGARLTRHFAPPEAQPAPPSAAPPWAFSGVFVVTAVRSPAEALAVFGGTVTSRGGSLLPVTLPAGAEVRAANVGGRWLEPGSWRSEASADGVRVHLPVPANGARFEVRYRLPVAPGALANRVRSGQPVLPVETPVRRWWAFAASVLPGWPVRAWDAEAPADLPELLGDPVVSASLISRSPVDEVRVASVTFAQATGLAVATFLLLVGWRAATRGRPVATWVVVGGLLVVGVAGLLGPPWWQRAAAVPLVGALVAAGATVLARGHRARGPAVAAAVALAGAFTFTTGLAQPVAPATVLLLTDAEGREVVQAPKTVLDRLATRAAPAGVVVTAAEYSATTDDATAKVAAKFVVSALDAGEPVANLPLAEARLERVTVNGTAAFPTSPKAGVYAVPLPGPGRHEIEVRFSVPITGAGTERDFRFGVPECPSAKVLADLPGSAKQVQVVGRIGRQVATPGQRVRLETDAGGVRSVQVRWRDGTGGAAVVKVREGCVWDVKEAGAELTACYIVRVEQGTISSLRFSVPAELDPLGVAVRPLDAGAVASLRDWRFETEQNGFRPLQLDFQGPTSGRVLVVLTLDPSKAATRQPVLRFPRVLYPDNSTPEPDAAYGLRVKGLVIDSFTPVGVIDYSPEALTRDFASVSDLKFDPNTPVRVFRPVAGRVPELRPTVRPDLNVPDATQDTAWHIGATRADATGNLRWSGKQPVSLVEFTLAVGKVTEVRAADVSAWSQIGSRVQVWLKRPATDGELAWSATVTAPPFPFEAATPRVTDAKLTSDTVRVRPSAGFALQVERDRGWAPVPSASGSVTFRTTAVTPPVRVALAATPPVRATEDLGWLSPRPTPAITPPPLPPVANTVPEVAPVETPTELVPDADVRWVWPASGAVAWAAVVVALAVLLVRFPRSLWPEQFALVGALFGSAVVGGWWLGLVAWAVARVVWLGELVFRARAARSA